MASAALRRLRLSRNVDAENDVQVDLDFTSNTDGASGSVPATSQGVGGSGGAEEPGPQAETVGRSRPNEEEEI
ncbi:hypothetical protein SESBI_04131 [Sesbania bispinosa]|nr:hypothetical protein SESBI_04131 [Sesbania bispinosa]